MSVKDYYGIDGFCVYAKSSQDVYDALDRIDSQLSDEMDKATEIIARRSPQIAENKVKQLEAAQQIIEEAMMKLIDIEGVRA